MNGRFEHNLCMGYLRFNYRIYPNNSQIIQAKITSDACRFVWNYFLGKRSLLWRTQHRVFNESDCKKELPYLKKVFPWLKDADSTALQKTCEDLQQAFENFWNGSGYPQFKSKKRSYIAFGSKNVNGTIRLSEDKHYIFIPKLKMTRIRFSREIPGKITSISINQKPSGKFFISIVVQVPDSYVRGTNFGEKRGLDLGLKDFYILDNGDKLPNGRFLISLEHDIKKLQRQLSRKKKGSVRYKKCRIKLARLHEKIANMRTDNLHKASTYLAKLCEILCIEDLNIAGMRKCHPLAKAISDASWSSFIKMLEYKMPLYGGTIVKIPRFYASSQTCHICGHRNPKTKDLTVREWICPKCGSFHDRDINAAINILTKGLEIYNLNIKTQPA